MKKYTLVLLTLFLFIGAQAAHAATIYSNSSTGNDTTGDGSSGSPYATFTKAYEAASSGDTINLTGTFDWANAGETDSASGAGMTLAKDLTIVGQGESSTIVEGYSADTGGDRTVFTINSGTTVTMENLTIQNGYAAYAGSTGGGITNNGTLTLDNVDVTNNTFSYTGDYHGAGGIYTGIGSTLTLATSTVANNTFDGAFYGAGGIYVEGDVGGATVVIQASTISGNSAQSTSPSSYPDSYAEPAGGIASFRGALTLTDSTISGNYTNAYGGGMNLYDDYGYGPTIITNSTIANNTADQGDGGILYTFVNEGDGTNGLWVKNSIIAYNIGAIGAEDDYHAYNSTSGDFTMDDGYNIVGISTNKTWNATGDITSLTGLGLAGSVAVNGATNGVETLALSADSTAINGGDSADNDGVPVPGVDERGLYRNSLVDIGAYEYAGLLVSPNPATTGGSLVNVAHSVPAKPALTISNITATSALALGGTNEQNGITGVGVAYGTSSSALMHKDLPTSGTIQYSLDLTALSCGTTYQIYAYATNALGTTDSDTQSFTTSACVSSTGSTASASSDGSQAVSVTVLAPTIMTSPVSTATSSPVASPAVTSSSVYTRDLHLGMSGTDVQALQHFLNTHGFAIASSGSGSAGNETTHFGKATKAALAKYQASVGITPALGYFGSVTRAYVEAHP
ncbi:MAG: choice-of-anchor Q domain-containing protein [Candidatus Pacebacteria bacterium]|nr:choice-of-anchor Q domain-containing protein [Candidatus Paceibacterota bacterium]